MDTRSGDLAPEVQRFFDRTALSYDRAYRAAGVGGRILRERATVAVDLLGSGPGEVLDVGMGTGVLCAELDRRGWAVSGIDISAAMIDGAIARLPQREPYLVQGSIHAIPFANGTFDAVAATGVLEYAVDDLPRALEELERVLRPSGVAVVSFPNQRAPMNVWRGRVLYPLVRIAKRVVPTDRPAPLSVARVSYDRFRAMLAEAGLAVDTVVPVGARPLPAGLAHRVESRRDWIAFGLSVQYVVRARKPA